MKKQKFETLPPTTRVQQKHGDKKATVIFDLGEWIVVDFDGGSKNLCHAVLKEAYEIIK